ncbi:MAG TPA: DUF1634 domain-containing protein [Planctomycetota bacterium]|nr:DUF1634 domain-containing protein [Planctomycetota bacterium]
MKIPRSRDESPVAALVTLGGVTAAAAIMAVGLVRLAWTAEPVDAVPLAVGALLRGVREVDPAAWTAVGCVVLMATPFLRVLLLAFTFARRRRAPFAIAAVAVLAILATGIALA